MGQRLRLQVEFSHCHSVLILGKGEGRQVLMRCALRICRWLCTRLPLAGGRRIGRGPCGQAKSASGPRHTGELARRFACRKACTQRCAHTGRGYLPGRRCWTRGQSLPFHLYFSFLSPGLRCAILAPCSLACQCVPRFIGKVRGLLVCPGWQMEEGGTVKQMAQELEVGALFKAASKSPNAEVAALGAILTRTFS